MTTASPFWIIETSDGQHFLGGRTNNGSLAALVFKTEAMAQEFVDSKGLDTTHKVVAIQPADVPEWLRNAFKRGFAELYINATASDGTHRVVPIAAMLIEIEGGERQG